MPWKTRRAAAVTSAADPGRSLTARTGVISASKLVHGRGSRSAPTSVFSSLRMAAVNTRDCGRRSMLE